MFHHLEKKDTGKGIGFFLTSVMWLFIYLQIRNELTMILIHYGKMLQFKIIRIVMKNDRI